MFSHCKPYRCNIYKILPAVLAILLGCSFASASKKKNPDVRPRIALLGDSMTWIGGDSCQKLTGWSHVLKESGMAEYIDVYARSGATWTNTKATRRNPEHYTEILHDDNVVYNQAVRLIEKSDNGKTIPDIIILFAGANDAWFASKRPGIFDSPSSQPNNPTTQQPNNFTSLSGSIQLVEDMLHTRFPEATLLFVAPLQMSKTSAHTIHLVADIIEETASERGWTTLRADKETCISHDQEARAHIYTSDGVHTNPEGAKILGEYILHYLQNLTPLHSQLTTHN